MVRCVSCFLGTVLLSCGLPIFLARIKLRLVRASVHTHLDARGRAWVSFLDGLQLVLLGKSLSLVKDSPSRSGWLASEP